jgi:hypothetical protein
LSGVSTANSLVLSSTAGITNAAAASLTVTNNASFSGTSITLGDQAGDAMNFGSLTFNSGGAVNIAEDSSTLLSGVSTANSLVLSSAAGITNAAGASLTVTNNASFSGTSVTLGDQAGDAINFGSLTFNSAGAVNIAEDSDTLLSGTSTADSLVLASSAGITNALASLTVTGNASFSGTSITLGDQAGDAMNFGSLTFNSAGAVNIAEDSSTRIVGANTGSTIQVTADSPMSVEGNVTGTAGITLTAGEEPAAGDTLTVVGGVTVSTTGGNVTLQAGDGIALNAGSTVSASGSVTLNVAFGGDADGSTSELAGTIASSAAVAVNGNAGNDTLAIRGTAVLPAVGLVFEGNAGNDALNVYFASTHAHQNLVFHGGSGDDSLVIDGTEASDVYCIKDFNQTISWKKAGDPSYVKVIQNYAGVENLTVNTGLGSDAVTFECSTAATGLKKVTVNAGGDALLDGFKVVGTNTSHILSAKEKSTIDPKDVVFDDTIIVNNAASGTVYGSIPSFGVLGINRLQLFGNNGASQDKGNNRLANNTVVKSFVVGGDGRDVVAGGSNNDYLIGGAGKDWLWGNVGSDILLPDYAYTPPADPDTAVPPYGSLTVVNGGTGESGDQIDGDRAYSDDVIANPGLLKVKRPGVDTAVYSGVDTLTRIEQWAGKGGKISVSMWLQAKFLSAKQVKKLIDDILASDLVKPFPKGPDPQPAVKASKAAVAVPTAATIPTVTAAAAKSAVQGPQPQYAAALMSVLASDFPTAPFAGSKIRRSS